MKRHSYRHRLATLVRILIHRTHGQDLIEYAILTSIATAVGVLLLSQIGQKVADIYNDVAQEVIADGGVGGAGGSGGDPGGGTGGGGTGGGGTGGGGTGGGGTGGGGTGGGGTGGGGRGGGRGGN